MTNLACQIIVLLVTNFSPASVTYEHCPDCGLNYISATKPSGPYYDSPFISWVGHRSWQDHSQFIKTNQVPKSVSTQTWAVVKLDGIEKRVKMRDSDDDRCLISVRSWYFTNCMALTN